MQCTYYVYILANEANTVLYIGVTGDLKQRIEQHKSKMVEGFTKKYNVTKLVYFEKYNEVETAILREKQLKRWTRIKKENLIKRGNPEMAELNVSF